MPMPKKTGRPSESGYIGVCPYRAKNLWRAKIVVNKRMIYIGIFNTAIDAARAYDVKARKFGKEHLNFPDDAPVPDESPDKDAEELPTPVRAWERDYGQ